MVVACVVGTWGVEVQWMLELDLVGVVVSRRRPVESLC